MKIKQYITLAMKPSIVKRGLKFSIVVGTILIAINHGDTILKGQLTSTHLYKMVLTYSVPYIVSSLSSIQAILHQQNKTKKPNP